MCLNPPQHAAVFVVDEKTAIQAPNRLDPVQSLSPDRAERHSFEYCYQGTSSLYVALEIQTGKVVGNSAVRHARQEFVGFLGQVVAEDRPQQGIHIILDSFSAHKTEAVREFLAHKPQVRLRFTPNSSSWLNQVEIWFAKIERDVIAGGVFASVWNLTRKLRRYINAYTASGRPIQRNYVRHQPPDSY